MTFAELQDEVLVRTKPGTTLEADIPDLVNEAVLHIAEEPGLILPSLKTITSVETVVDQSYTNIPSGFSGKILYASSGGCKLGIHNTVEDLLQYSPDLSDEGDLVSLALEDQILWYTERPTEATTIMLLLYKNPEVLVLDSDIPTEIPVHLHRETIVPYAAKRFWELWEQGDDSTLINTRVEDEKYQKGLQKIRQYVASRRRGMSRSVWNI